MKQVDFRKKFQKQFQKLSRKHQDQFQARLQEFLIDSTLPHLHYHSLKGTLSGYKSINITGDIRAIFREEGDTLVIFLMIGSHSELY